MLISLLQRLLTPFRSHAGIDKTRYTDRSRAAMLAANSFALAKDYAEIHPQHMLLGILSLSESVAAAALTELKIDLPEVQSKLALFAPTVPNSADAGFSKLPMAADTHQVIECAWKESLHLGDDYVGTQHLVLGVLSHGTNLAARVLREAGVELDVARKAVVAVLSTPPPKPDSTAS